MKIKNKEHFQLNPSYNQPDPPNQKNETIFSFRYQKTVKTMLIKTISSQKTFNE